MAQSSNLQKIKRAATLDELAYRHIKAAILDGTFRPGEFLAEIQVAHDLGTSKTPVRKALARLCQERFLVNVPGKGYYVADISVEDIIEIYQLRAVLECYLVRKTASTFTDVELDELQSLLEAADVALTAGDHGRFIDLNRQFHHSFDRKYGNRRISDVLTNLDEHVRRILLFLLSDDQEILQASHQDHHLIMTALQERDGETAAQVMERHLQRFCETLIAGQRIDDSEIASSGP